jgi:feruloyl esterase
MKFGCRSLVAAAGAALFGCNGSISAAETCENLAGLKLEDTKVTKAEAVTPNPDWPYPDSLFTAFGPPGGGVKVPFCRVAATIAPAIDFELWLPKDWNGKYQGIGNGGYTGAINYPAMGAAVARGYATASTDMGHASKDMFDSSWALGQPELIKDFGYRAHHLVTVISKEIIAAHYGKPAEYAYFNGCSSGGWQGFTEVQKYPEDFNGIIAGAPAHNFVQLQVPDLLANQAALKNPEGNLGQAESQLLAGAAVKACDAKDGVSDGLISDPMGCEFDPASLQCTAGKTEQCLTAAQVERAKQSYGPRKSAGGMWLYPGPAYGSPLFFGPPATVTSAELPSGIPLVSMSNGKLPFDYLSFDPDKHLPALEAEFKDVLTSMNPDLRPFKARGGKIIVYHGWMDPAISPYNSIHYYDAVAEVVGRESMDDFYRMFFVPSMGHCTGGPGPTVFDAVTALERWVEDGVAPARIEAAHLTNGKPDRTRPLCPYPQVAVYKGTGSTDEAANFECRVPDRRVSVH